MDDLSRRTAIKALGVGAVGMSAHMPVAAGAAGQPSSGLAFAATHQPKPLRFDPAKLDGLSERLIRSHWENNYIG